MLSPDTPAIISQRILCGERPSSILRDLLAISSEFTKYDLANPVTEAFPKQDHWLLIDAVWQWREREKSEAWDTIFDFRLIRQLIALGEPLPWSADECEEELRRVQPAIDESNRHVKLKTDEATSFDALKAKISDLDGKVSCIEALWDGDTNGWFVRMSAVMLNDSVHKAHFLVSISKGSDARLFSGQVPPWPEAIHAAKIGSQLANCFGAEFYFPSPEAPNIGMVPWLDRMT